MEGLGVTDAGFWSGRRVLVTGHTGFKGSWLATWLLRLGAEVHGIALPPDTGPALFTQLGLAERMVSILQDIRVAEALSGAVREAAPEVVFHLAAQPLVRASYDDPLGTWSTNVMGTANLLQALTDLGHPCSVVVVTTDKVYHNNEWVHPYRETDRLGGRDPYSASKAATELLVDSWRKSFLPGTGVQLASARAGNVIGGGDWARDRIVPDFVRAQRDGSALSLRNPGSTRPWQHVLEPLDGYMTLARALTESGDVAAEAWNFGPDAAAERSVGDLVEASNRHWPGDWSAEHDPSAPHEAGRLTLSTAKARALLGWAPAWNFDRSVAETIAWYRGEADGACPKTLCDDQIARYEASR